MLKQIVTLLEQFEPNNLPESATKAQILQFIAANPDNCLLRSNLVAHITASAWVIDQQTGSHALLVKHAKLNKWLQPGGHADGDPDLIGVALKEVEEETGVLIETPALTIFDLDVHLIPFHKNIPPHLHLDLRFLFKADMQVPLKISPESHDLRWVAFEEIPTLGVDQSVIRMLEKSKKLTS